VALQSGDWIDNREHAVLVAWVDEGSQTALQNPVSEHLITLSKQVRTGLLILRAHLSPNKRQHPVVAQFFEEWVSLERWLVNLDGHGCPQLWRQL